MQGTDGTGALSRLRQRIDGAASHEAAEVAAALREAADYLAPCLAPPCALAVAVPAITAVGREGSLARQYGAVCRYALVDVAPRWLPAFTPAQRSACFDALFLPPLTAASASAAIACGSTATTTTAPPRLCAFLALCDAAQVLTEAATSAAADDESTASTGSEARVLSPSLREGAAAAVQQKKECRDDRYVSRRKAAGQLAMARAADAEMRACSFAHIARLLARLLGLQQQ